MQDDWSYLELKCMLEYRNVFENGKHLKRNMEIHSKYDFQSLDSCHVREKTSHSWNTNHADQIQNCEKLGLQKEQYRIRSHPSKLHHWSIYEGQDVGEHLCHKKVIITLCMCYLAYCGGNNYGHCIDLPLVGMGMSENVDISQELFLGL